MQLRARELPGHLRKQLLPVYVVSGDEPLQLRESCDWIRAAARRAGIVERVLLEAAPRGFDWSSLREASDSMSLFADRRLIELHLPSARPGVEGSRTLTDYLGRDSGQDVLLLVMGAVDRQTLGSKWMRALDRVGAIIRVWPVTAEELPRWLRQRAESLGMGLDPAAAALLAERVQGNLLAAAQELEKLHLLHGDAHLDLETVAQSVLDSARFDLFELIDTALAGRTGDALRMLRGLKAEGAEPPAMLWAFLRDIETLQAGRRMIAAGDSPERVTSTLGVWKKRQGVFRSALERHDESSLQRLLELAFAVDAGSKGYGDAPAWDSFELLVLCLGGGCAAQALGMPAEAILSRR